MSYNPSSDFLGLWRAVSGGVEKGEMPGLDFVVAALNRAGLLRVVTSATAPASNQIGTAWFRPANPSFSSEGALFLWDGSTYVPATPELFHGSGGGTGGGGDGGGGNGTGDADMAIISTSPPSNPVAGQQWWNGTIMQVWDGTSWHTVGLTGTVPTTTQMFSIGQGSTPTFTNALWMTMPWVSAPGVLVGAWDAITHKYTPSKPGYYLSTFFSNYNLTAAGSSGRAVQQNDNNANLDHTFSIAQVNGNAAQSGWLSATSVVYMNGTTDYLRMWVFDTFGNTSVNETIWVCDLLP